MLDFQQLAFNGKNTEALFCPPGLCTNHRPRSLYIHYCRGPDFSSLALVVLVNAV